MLNKSGKTKTDLLFLIPEDYPEIEVKKILKNANIITWNQLYDFVHNNQFENKSLRAFAHMCGR